MIKMNDFKRDDEALVKAQLEAVERVIRSGWYVLGPEVAAFETEWAEWTGAKYAVGVANGMDALEIGLRATGIGPGDEVITTSMTAFATVLSILRAGALPVLADIDPETANIDPESVVRCLSPKTKAVMVVHLYGQAAALEQLSKICSDKGIMLFEDCAQAHGAKASGVAVGNWSVFGGWSFYPTKNLGCIGDGGALTTNDARVAEEARKIRNYGQSVRYEHPIIGLNSRLDELQAAILRERLKYLETWTTQRHEIALTYTKQIANPAVRVLPMPADPTRHVHHLFVVTTQNRQALQTHMKKCGIDCLFHYPIPVHHQEPCKNLRQDPMGLAAAEKHALECVSLPIHPQMLETEVDQVIETINSWVAE